MKDEPAKGETTDLFPVPVEKRVSELKEEITDDIESDNEKLDANPFASASTPPEIVQANRQVDPPVVITPLPSATNEKELAKSSNGQMIPWDVRIHAKSKKINADGSWRVKPGIDRDEFLPAIEDEIVQAMNASPKQEDVSAAVTPPIQDSQPAPATDVTDHGIPTPPVPPTDLSAIDSFSKLLPVITKAKAAGSLTDSAINEAVKTLGLPQFGSLAVRPDLIQQFIQLVGI